jgi:serine/threonine protein kinase/formylglycine-generating enzyme required for sulfatase activity
MSENTVSGMDCNEDPQEAILSAPLPREIGRYRVEKILGQGGFGLVYLARDEQLQRLVAIKVPHPRLVSRPKDAEAYLTEARTVANLDHPNIVPVFDIGTSPNFPCFFVSKFVEGSTLSKKISKDRPSFAAATEMVITIADALHYAHRKGLVHRDIKPGNILIDASGKPFVVDFGLALKEENVGHGPRYGGTPAYMSPEQARGEGHRVDGRSDIFSLGIVFYELLVGRQPFRADSQAEVMEQVTNFEPRPLRQIDESIPKELERICFKAMSKRASERYMTAKDLADDLRHFFDQSTIEEKRALANVPLTASLSSAPASTPVSTPVTAVISDSQPLKVVPKGLRSFDAHDADFFLELLPGPRDREGLPDSLRFWKSHIEETDPEETFAVGLIYGPSGCGKSSLVKAGLLPRLSRDVLVVYLEATAEETESRLLNGLKRRCPGLAPVANTPVANAPGSPLKDALARLRRGQEIPTGKKVVIILDQFEQWLQGKNQEQSAELVGAMRQCDGARVQCIVMVRDDFWMAATRFMRELEIRLVEGRNSAPVDLFDLDHSKKVLAAYGRAFGKLPQNPAENSKEQKDFLQQAVAGLAQLDKVICVRLALFAEMMKSKPWTPASLKAVGGTEGIGATFLEETFSAASAPPEHRFHQKAARAVLRSLLPESGTDIKGHMRSHAELLEASGYSGRPKDFEELIGILDSEIRLITPTDPEGMDEEKYEGGRMKDEKNKNSDSSFIPHPSSLRYYQLTHDYLVHSLRTWLTRKQKESRRGRAELLLADRAAIWNARPENRQLPSLGQWFSIRWRTQKKNWTEPQRKMMAKASRVLALRGVTLVALFMIITVGGMGIRGYVMEQKAAYAAGLVQSLVRAEITHVPAIVKQMKDYRQWVDPLLQDAITEAQENGDARIELHASLALLPVDPNQKEFLLGRLLDAAPREVPIIREALLPYKAELVGPLWATVEKPALGQKQQRLRAASALATFDPESPRWQKVQNQVADDLINAPATNLSAWLDSLRPVGEKLLAQLTQAYRDTNRHETERSQATTILADFAADNAEVLAELVMDADEKQFAVVFPKLQEHGENGLASLTGELKRQLLPKSMNWQVRFFDWRNKGASSQVNWEALFKSPPIDEVNMSRLFFDKRSGLPTTKVPTEYFAAVASCEIVLSTNSYAFTVIFDDGVRVWFDDKIVCDNWKSNIPTSENILVKTEPGRHTIKIEYFQITAGYDLVFFDPEADLATMARRQANAAVALLRMKHSEKVWPLLKDSNDPRVRAYLMDRLGPLGADVGAISKGLESEKDLAIRRALILSLGEFAEGQISLSERSALIEKLFLIYESEPDAGLHAAASWLLRQWNQGVKLNALDEKLRTNEAQLQKALRATLTQEQLQRLSTLATEIKDLQNQLSVSQQKLPQRQKEWERKLLERPVQFPASLQDGLIAHYPLDTAEGKKFANAVQGQLPGTYQGIGNPEWVPGVVGQALRLNGSGTIDCGTALQLDTKDAMSYGCWFMAQIGSDQGTLVGKYSGGGASPVGADRGFEIYVDPKKAEVVAEWANQWPQNTLIVHAKLDAPTGWHHVFVTYDGSASAAGVRIYLDGRLAPMTVQLDLLSKTIRNTVPLQIGRRASGRIFRGEIDDVRIYKRSLGDDEVKLIYEAGIQALVASPERTLFLKILLAVHYRSLDASLRELTGQLSAAQKSRRDVQPNWNRRWYVNSQGQTMVVMHATEGSLGDALPGEKGKKENDKSHEKVRGRTFAMAANPVTVAEYKLFNSSYSFTKRNAPTADCPVVSTSWFQAVEYCNWLSEKENIPPDQWCYEIAFKGALAKLKQNYLSLTGYRLPHEAEWEMAYRAGGAVTSHFHKESTEFLGKYVTYKDNSGGRSWPVGSKRPNELGIFDVMGNVWCWCQEEFKDNPVGQDKEDDLIINPQQNRLLRGAGFNASWAQAITADRLSRPPTQRSSDYGFRPVRTILVE